MSELIALTAIMAVYVVFGALISWVDMRDRKR